MAKFNINNKDISVGVPKVEDKGKYVSVSITNMVYDKDAKAEKEQTVTATATGKQADFLKKLAADSPEVLIAITTKQNGNYTNVDEVTAYAGLFTEEAKTGDGTWGVLFGEVRESTHGKPFISVRTYDTEAGESVATSVWVNKTQKTEKVWDKLIKKGRKVALSGFVSVNVDGDSVFTRMNVCGIKAF